VLVFACKLFFIVQGTNWLTDTELIYANISFLKGWLVCGIVSQQVMNILKVLVVLKKVGLSKYLLCEWFICNDFNNACTVRVYWCKCAWSRDHATSLVTAVLPPPGQRSRTSPLDNSNDRRKCLCLVSWSAVPCVWTLRALTRNLTYLLTYLPVSALALTSVSFSRNLQVHFFIVIWPKTVIERERESLLAK